MKLTLKARATSARCAYCHEGLPREALTCPDCSTLLHEDCELDFCPTLGCASLKTWELIGTVAPELRRTVSSRHLRSYAPSPHRLWPLLAGLLVGSVALLVTRADVEPVASTSALTSNIPLPILRLVPRESSLASGWRETDHTTLVSLDLVQPGDAARFTAPAEGTR